MRHQHVQPAEIRQRHQHVPEIPHRQAAADPGVHEAPPWQRPHLVPRAGRSLVVCETITRWPRPARPLASSSATRSIPPRLAPTTAARTEHADRQPRATFCSAREARVMAVADVMWPRRPQPLKALSASVAKELSGSQSASARWPVAPKARRRSRPSARRRASASPRLAPPAAPTPRRIVRISGAAPNLDVTTGTRAEGFDHRRARTVPARRSVGSRCRRGQQVWTSSPTQPTAPRVEALRAPSRESAPVSFPLAFCGRPPASTPRASRGNPPQRVEQHGVPLEGSVRPTCTTTTASAGVSADV